jgi:hypothetical protein
MRKLFLACLLVVLAQAGVYCQTKGEIQVGVSPYGNVVIKGKGDNTGVMTNKFAFSRPAFSLAYNVTPMYIAGKQFEFNYFKANFQNQMGMDSIACSQYSLNAFYSFGLTSKRIQPRLYLGGGLAYYGAPMANLHFNLGAKASLNFYITPHLGFYAGGFYYHSILSRKLSETRYGAEVGLVYSFKRTFEPKVSARGMKHRRATEKLTVGVLNEWDTYLEDAKITLVAGDGTRCGSPSREAKLCVFDHLRPGPYTITIERNGYNTISEQIYVSKHSKKEKREGKTDLLTYTLQTKYRSPSIKDIHEAMANARVERTEGFVTYYVVDAFNSYTGAVTDMMDNRNFLLVKSSTYKEVGTSYTRSFMFRNLLEEKIRIANNNPNLRMPPLINSKESDEFYAQYVKNYPELASAYRALFAKVNKEYMLEVQPKAKERILHFCEGSPFESGIMEGFDVLKSFVSRRDAVDYVYYLTPNSGYIVNKEMTYTGGIVNGKAEGHGIMVKPIDYFSRIKDDERKIRDTYEGEFKDGHMNGPIVRKWRAERYEAINGKTYEFSDNYVDRFEFEESGTYKDGQWDGQTEFKAVIGGYSDRITYTYQNGIVVSQTNTRTSLSDHLASRYLSMGEKTDVDKDMILNTRVPQVRSSRTLNSGNNQEEEITYEDGTVAKLAVMNQGSRGWEYIVWSDNDHYSTFDRDKALRAIYVYWKYCVKKSYNKDAVVHILNTYGLPVWQ